jgi:hypothetical protein
MWGYATSVGCRDLEYLIYTALACCTRAVLLRAPACLPYCVRAVCSCYVCSVGAWSRDIYTKHKKKNTKNQNQKPKNLNIDP